MSASIARLKEELQQLFVDCMPVSAQTEPHLRAVLDETLAHPGSMVRAILATRVAAVSGMAHEPARHLAIAIEYFHTASLLFDDLPAMDNASTRRGTPCAHTRHGEPAAILAALALINRAYALVWKSMVGIEPARQAAALEFLEAQLGINGVLNGQSHDLHYHLQRSKPRPEAIALGKTVTLIRLALVMPAMLGGAVGRRVEVLNRIAVLWGLAYQTLDDLKDLLLSDQQLGKTTARDSLLHRPNLALSIGTERAFARVHKLLSLSDRAEAELESHAQGWAFLSTIRSQFTRELTYLSEFDLARAS